MLDNGLLAHLGQKVTGHRLWRSVFRHGYPETSRTRSLAIYSNVFLHLHPVRIRREALRVTYSFCLGGISFLLFLILTVTGVLLMFYYVPSVERAYFDMQALESQIVFGMLLRNLHRWSAHGMIIAVILHMCRIFYTGSYKAPREFNWVVGVILLVLTLLASFTGYLLPWDQLSYWAITVGTNMVQYAPIVGPEMRFLLLGGLDVGPNALIRFYTLHVIGIPLAMAALIALHFWRIRKDGFSGPL